MLPVLQGWVLVLLKLLLATVSAASGAQPQNVAAAGFPVSARELVAVSVLLLIDIFSISYQRAPCAASHS